MKSFVYHIQINVSEKKKSFPFYKELLALLGYKILFEKGPVLGMGNKTTDIWLIQTSVKFKSNKYHRKNTGLNHISFGVESKDDVDQITKDFIKLKNIRPLYNSPKEFPEYEAGYYAVFFEDPDKIKLEITYKPGFKERGIFNK